MRPSLIFASIFLMPMGSRAAERADSGQVKADSQGWAHHGEFVILTTPDGANLPASAAVDEFPVLVRLHKDWFDFSQVKPSGEDIRFANNKGETLAYQIEDWDPAGGMASIWVRIPKIMGNSQQKLQMRWGNAAAASESDAKAVFNRSNGYLSVWHMNEPMSDAVGTLETKDTGTTPSKGIIGQARHFDGGHGISCGEKIDTYPVGAASHSSEAWIRIEKANGSVIAWGNEKAQGKVVMQVASPPHIRMDCYFAGGNVTSESMLPKDEWLHVMHTYREGESRIYVNGVLDGESTKGAPLAIQTPARLWIGGWYNRYDFVGDIDEARVSNVMRSPEWARLEYENQKPMQTLVGPLVQAGNTFSVSPSQLVVEESKSAAITAQAGGALKVYWILKKAGNEQVVATDRFEYKFEAGRVTGDESATMVFKAIYPNEVKIRGIPIKVREGVPDPLFSLKAPIAWDGRTEIEVVPQISNLAAMRAMGAGDLKIGWKVSGMATVHQALPGKLSLQRSQNSGELTVTATASNGGTPAVKTIKIKVAEPKSDPWVKRDAAADEQPEDGQFYARDDKNEGTLDYNGKLEQAADSVFINLYAGDKLVATEKSKPAADHSYQLSVKLKPGLIHYKVEFGTVRGGRETVEKTVNDLSCGDAYIIDGQSNALATDTHEESPAETYEWIRSYGRPETKTTGSGENLWCKPVWKARNGEKAELGWWGMELAKRLVASQKIPIFVVNGAVGGTRIDQHQRNEADPTDLMTIYGRMLWRVQQAKLTHGIRGILWHQGENNQGAASPSGDFDWKSYQEDFVAMSSGWKRDFPNVRHYYVFQIWPNSCSMAGTSGAGNMIREIQRTLPQLYSNLSVMSTLGVKPPGGCHFPLAGWSEFARLIQPLIERDFYGLKVTEPITPPNVIRASYTSPAKDAITLEFDQPVAWNEALVSQFYLDSEKGSAVSGSVKGNVLTIKLKGAASAKTITYLNESEWSPDLLLMGTNGIAALTFCNVPLGVP